MDELSRDDIKRGMNIAAQLVRRYGANYWPVLERLKREYDVLDNREKLLASLIQDATVDDLDYSPCQN